MRLIDADALPEKRFVNPKNHAKSIAESLVEFYNGWNAYRNEVDSAPTVSPDDVGGVVHCKNCKWCHAGYCEKYDDLIPWGCANKPWEDWFCADGKRREIIKEAQDAD